MFNDSPQCGHRRPHAFATENTTDITEIPNKTTASSRLSKWLIARLKENSPIIKLRKAINEDLIISILQANPFLIDVSFLSHNN